jgi:hypothetical protein
MSAVGAVLTVEHRNRVSVAWAPIPQIARDGRRSELARTHPQKQRLSATGSRYRPTPNYPGIRSNASVNPCVHHWQLQKRNHRSANR